MKPWTPLRKNVHANIFSFIRLSFSVLITLVTLGMVKTCTCDFTLQLVCVRSNPIHCLAPPFPRSLMMCPACSLCILMCQKRDSLLSPRGASRALQMVILGQDGEAWWVQIMCFSFTTLYPPSSTQQIFPSCLLIFLFFFFRLFWLYPWLCHFIVPSMSGTCLCITAEPCMA